MIDIPKQESDKVDYKRDITAWLILVFVIALLCVLKPPVVLNDTVMYLPRVTDLKPIDKDQVKVITTDLKNSYFLYDKVGFITIILPYVANNEKELAYNAIENARLIAANAGADKLLVELIVTLPWFDTGKTVFRLQAIALK